MQGQGRNTINKESAFGACQKYHLACESRFLLSRRMPPPFFHFDLNAGCGHNIEANVVGTPTMFINYARQYPDLPVQAWFVEKHRGRATELKQRLVNSGLLNGHLFGLERHFEVCNESNAQVLTRLVDHVARFDRPEQASGCVISDPNGWSPHTGALDLATAQMVLSRVPRFMVLLNFPWGRAKAMHPYKERGELGPIKHVTLRKVADHFPLRPHWLISEPSGQYCYLCGTSRPYKEWQRPDGWRLVDVTSTRGRELVRYYDEIQSEATVVA